MGKRQKVLASAAIMSSVVMLSGAITVELLYEGIYERHRARLSETAQSRAGLIETAARFHRTYSRDYPGGARAATISQVANAFESFKEFGQTGEFSLAERAGDEIVFVLRHDQELDLTPERVSLSFELAEPMRRALSGESGTMTGLDYRGAEVLAAYQPVAALDMGLVAKIDIAEIREPFLIAGLAGASASVALGAIGTALFWRLSDSVIRRLEKRVRERTVELEAVNQELEAFSYSVSHDLRAPLRAMNGFSQALLEDYGAKLDAEGRDHLERVRAGSQRMAQLIDDLLTLSRVTRGALDRREVDLSADARAIAERLRQSAPERVVTFDIAPAAVAECDARLLRVALENLLDNAWKFTSKRPRARVAFGVTEHDGRPAYFVRDDGAGFDMAYADKLFQPFQRLHRVEEFPGTGIGLATVARIIHRHGGRVWVDSGIGQGTTVYFTI